MNSGRCAEKNESTARKSSKSKSARVRVSKLTNPDSFNRCKIALPTNPRCPVTKIFESARNDPIKIKCTGVTGSKARNAVDQIQAIPVLIQGKPVTGRNLLDNLAGKRSPLLEN